MREMKRRWGRERRMMWNFVGLGILMWQYLEEATKFLLVSTFNLYIIDYRYIYFGLYTYALGSIRFD